MPARIKSDYINAYIDLDFICSHGFTPRTLHSLIGVLLSYTSYNSTVQYKKVRK